jgi:hypothetical protein
MTFRFRGQVEAELGRSLTDAELQEVASLDELTDDQIAVLAAIRRHNRMAPMLYVKAVVPTADHHAVIKLIDEDLVRIASERLRPDDLPNQELFEHYAGRPLRPLERVRVESFEQLSSDQIALARTLARADLATGFLYLSRVAPGESTERWYKLAKHLAKG